MHARTPHTHSHTLTHTHTHSHTLTHTHTHSHTLTHTHTHSHTLTHSHTHSHTLTHSHTHTLTNTKCCSDRNYPAGKAFASVITRWVFITSHPHSTTHHPSYTAST